MKHKILHGIICIFLVAGIPRDFDVPDPEITWKHKTIPKERNVAEGRDYRIFVMGEKRHPHETTLAAGAFHDTMGGVRMGQGERHGIVMEFSFGITAPYAQYGTVYGSSPQYSLGIRRGENPPAGLLPEFTVRYYRLESREGNENGKSFFTNIQGSLGLRYMIMIRPPGCISRYDFFNKPFSLYARASEGVTRLSFEYSGRAASIVEYIHTAEAGAGITFPLYGGLTAGFDFGYRHIAVKHVPLQSLNYSMTLGCRM